MALLARLDGPLAIGIVTCLVGGTALLLTRSRGAFIALCAALVAFVWSARRTAPITSNTPANVTTLILIGLFVGILALAGGRRSVASPTRRWISRVAGESKGCAGSICFWILARRFSFSLTIVLSLPKRAKSDMLVRWG